MTALRSKPAFSLVILSICLSLGLDLQAKTIVDLTAEEISDLAAATSDKVPEIHDARMMAAAANARLATYGGLSREVVDFLTDQINELGSVQAYRVFLAKPEPIYLGDIHRMKSDMDLMIIPNEGEASLSAARSEEIARLKSRIEAKFPPDIFHSKMDMTVAREFFKKFPPSGEHFEAVSNLPITDRGVEFLPGLNVSRPGQNGKTTNLARWGLEQYSRRTLEFELNPAGLKPGDTYGNIRQVLRWIRYLSENPDAKVTDTTRSEIKKLLGDTLRTHRSEVISLLKGRSDNSSKTIDALDKLQRYTKSASYTGELLKEYGIADLMTQASADHHILTPMAKTAEHAIATENPKRLGVQANGQPFTVNHYTSYAAAQNMKEGALWRSDSAKIIEGQAMRNQGGFKVPVLYTSIPIGDTHGAASTETRVTFILNPDAIEGIDYERRGSVFGLITENAIAKDVNGSLKIQRPTFATLRTELVEKLESGAIRMHSIEREELVRSLAGILRPALNDDDANLFFRILEQEDKFSSLPAQMLAQLARTSPAVFTESRPISMKLRNAVLSQLESRAIRELVGKEIPISDELIKEIFASLRGREYLGDGVKDLLLTLRVKIKPELLSELIPDLGSELPGRRRLAHEVMRVLRPNNSTLLNAIFDQFLKAPNFNYGASGLLDDLDYHPDIERRMGGILETSKDRRLISIALRYFGKVDWRTSSHGNGQERVGTHAIQSEPIRKMVMTFLRDPDLQFRNDALRALAQIPNIAEHEPDLVQVAVRRLGSGHESIAAAKILDGYKGDDKAVIRRLSEFRKLPLGYFQTKFPDDSEYYNRLLSQPPLIAKVTNSPAGDVARSCSNRFAEIFRWLRMFKK